MSESATSINGSDAPSASHVIRLLGKGSEAVIRSSLEQFCGDLCELARQPRVQAHFAERKAFPLKPTKEKYRERFVTSWLTVGPAIHLGITTCQVINHELVGLGLKPLLYTTDFLQTGTDSFPTPFNILLEEVVKSKIDPNVFPVKSGQMTEFFKIVLSNVSKVYEGGCPEPGFSYEYTLQDMPPGSLEMSVSHDPKVASQALRISSIYSKDKSGISKAGNTYMIHSQYTFRNTTDNQEEWNKWRKEGKVNPSLSVQVDTILPEGTDVPAGDGSESGGNDIFTWLSPNSLPGPEMTIMHDQVSYKVCEVKDGDPQTGTWAYKVDKEADAANRIPVYPCVIRVGPPTQSSSTHFNEESKASASTRISAAGASSQNKAIA